MLIFSLARHLLIAFGGLSGLEESVELDKKIKVAYFSNFPFISNFKSFLLSWQAASVISIRNRVVYILLISIINIEIEKKTKVVFTLHPTFVYYITLKR